MQLLWKAPKGERLVARVIEQEQRAELNSNPRRRAGVLNLPPMAMI